MARHTSGAGTFARQEAVYKGTAEPRERVNLVTMTEMPVLGGQHVRREPWRQALVEQLYAETGDLS